MTDTDEIKRRLGAIETKLNDVHDWMQQRIGEEKAIDKLRARRAWIDRIATGAMVGGLVTALNWLVG